MIYLTIFLALLIFIYRYDYCGCSKGRTFWYVATLLTLIVVAGLRYRIGIDSIRYEEYYKNLHTLGELNTSDFLNTRFAPIYIIITSACRTITSDFTLVQFVVSAIVNCTIFWFIKSNTRHVFFAIFLYYIFLYLNLNTEVLREALAVSAFLISWPFYRKGQWVWYYVMAIVAFFCHVSALMMFVLPVLSLPGVRWLFTFGKRTIVICLVLAAVSFYVRYFLFDFVQMIAFTENMAERAEVYSKSDLSSSSLNIFGVLSTVIRYFIYPFLALCFLVGWKRGRQPQVIPEKQQVMTLCAVYVAILTIGIAIFTRYGNYFFFFIFILLADWIFSDFKAKNGRRIRLKPFYWVLIFVPLVSMQIYAAYFSKVNKSGSLKIYMMYYPYYHRLDPKEDPSRENIIRYSRHFS